MGTVAARRRARKAFMPGDDTDSPRAPCNTSANCVVENRRDHSLLLETGDFARDDCAHAVQRHLIARDESVTVATRPEECPAIRRLNVSQRLGGHALSTHPRDIAIADNVC